MTAYLTRHATADGPRWALDGRYLPAGFGLSAWLGLPAAQAWAELEALPRGEPAQAPLLAPIEDAQEAWASGVTYLSSRMAREAESQSADVYQKVYAAPRPELFFKASGWRVAGHGAGIRVRADSAWDVPEPELALLLDTAGQIRGYTVGNDVSSRSIEGENPLYLPQAKVYDGACALGPGIRLCAAAAMADLPISLEIERAGAAVFSGATRTSQIKRGLQELADYLFRELAFPQGAFLFTGTGIVPGEDFTLRSGDVVRIGIDGLVLENPVR
ncbi:fumarylacetoacetate hydrolase [Pseudoxanthomonas broegbernensis]|uniref:Fumarylacetoacetate hydrolase n=1 Tax=Pseudoxanthomonas broegbernensis TaxID=83619 RepID=A0A7V8GKS2_9GAMM|nr:fumarylacetoacetate hydrolase family protein [Pseudoxanthomonas broegbernensis]KAF1685318.1 fumarylacetoacetate hydrolase [Pseudoxanthomonas broegbernensis]MBB6066185.1 2-dehydro-3-deoxy-D-arabinonate dehydratase [Pseudoxanthomonas broegbernensis]